MPETIGLFGATGSTGKHFLKLALEAGYKVVALARDPSKVVVVDTKLLTVVQGSFTDTDAVKQVIQNSDYVVCMAGYTQGGAGTTYPKDMMLNFVKLATSMMMNDDKPKVFLYQSGAFASDKDGNTPFMLYIMKHTIGRMMGIFPHICDNEAVTKFLGSDECKVTYLITRPGMLKDMDSAEDKEAVLCENPPMGAMAFVDLAKCSLKAIKDESVYGKNLFVDYKKKE